MAVLHHVTAPLAHLQPLPAQANAPLPVVERLIELIQSPNYSPPQMPSTALQLLELSRQESVQPGVMVALLERDPMLAAELLRLAQSSLYGGSFAVRTLDEAIVRLGLNRTAELFLHAALEARVFRAPGYQKKMDELRRHSVAVAHLARLVSREAGVAHESAFICGLLHDVGIAASLITLVETCPAGEKVAPFDEVWPAIRLVHQKAGGILASTWNFPSEVTLVIERHHDFMIDERPHPLAAVVNLADWAANELGFGFEDEQDSEAGTHVLDALKLDASSAQQILAKASKTLERVI